MGLACLTSCLQKLGPQTIPPAEAGGGRGEGQAWRWDRPARSTAQKKARGGRGGSKTDRRARDARREQRSGRGWASLPLGRADGSGEAAAARDLRELECGRRGAGEARTAAPRRRGGGAPLLFLII